MRASAARVLCCTLALLWLAWSCGDASCLRDSDCDDGLVCSRDRCVVETRSSGDAGPGNEATAGSSGASGAGASSGGGGGRPPLPDSSVGGSASSAGSSGSSGAASSSAGSGGAGGSATAGRENLDASVGADAGSNPS